MNPLLAPDKKDKPDKGIYFLEAGCLQLSTYGLMADGRPSPSHDLYLFTRAQGSQHNRQTGDFNFKPLSSACVLSAQPLEREFKLGDQRKGPPAGEGWNPNIPPLLVIRPIVLLQEDSGTIAVIGQRMP